MTKKVRLKTEKKDLAGLERCPLCGYKLRKKAKTEKARLASIANGKKGGRPRKDQTANK